MASARTPRVKAPPPKQRRSKAAASPPPPSAPTTEPEDDDFGLFDIDRLSDEKKAMLMMSPAASELDPELFADTLEKAWLASQGWTPLEFLAKAYRNPYVPVKERISAAGKLLEYVHKRIPTQFGLGAAKDLPPFMPGGASNKMDLSKLSDKELDTFIALVNKANAE